jgi:hypothetical protein
MSQHDGGDGPELRGRLAGAAIIAALPGLARACLLAEH